MVRYSLILVMVLGVWLRLSNISPFKFYPDSYQSLIVGENLRNYHSVVGYLGEEGMLFPDFIVWTRSGYPMLINLVYGFLGDETRAAQLVAFLAGVLSILVTYIYIRAVFGDNLTGLVGAGLLAISFNHVVWGGFILTETVGVLLQLVMLWLLFLRVKEKSEIANWYDLVLGIVLALMFLTRYEYIVWLIPIGFLIFMRCPTPLIKITNILASFIFILSTFVYQYFPLRDALNSGFLTQIQSHLVLLASFLMILVFTAIFALRFPRILRVGFKWLAILLVFLISVTIIFQWPVAIPGMRDFFRRDFLIGGAALVGMIFMIRERGYLTLSAFSLFGIVFFSIVYYKINPAMQRYTTHLLPLLLIPASYGVVRLMYKGARGLFLPLLPLWEKVGMRVPLALILLVIVVLQGWVTYRGMRYWDEGVWFRESYEEMAAKKFLNLVTDKESIILVSFPESYYFNTKLTTYSLVDHQPYIYIDESLDDRPLVIIEDMGMRDQFPEFSKVLEERMKMLQINSFFVGEIYHYGDRAVKEDQPVMVYKTTVGELKKVLEEG